MSHPENSPASPPAGTVLMPISFGELIDKITILEIKSERIEAEDKRSHVETELDVAIAALHPFAELAETTLAQRHLLRSINERLWSVEDQLRALEHEHDFGARFVGLARSVYLLNDQRAALKRKLNELAGSELVEEKFFASTEAPWG